MGHSNFPPIAARTEVWRRARAADDALVDGNPCDFEKLWAGVSKCGKLIAAFRGMWR